MNFRRAIDIARARAGTMTAAELARLSGVSKGSLQVIRGGGDCNPRIKQLERICSVLNIKVSELIALAEEGDK